MKGSHGALGPSAPLGERHPSNTLHPVEWRARMGDAGAMAGPELEVSHNCIINYLNNKYVFKKCWGFGPSNLKE